MKKADDSVIHQKPPWSLWPTTRRAWIRLACLIGTTAGGIAFAGWYTMSMPKSSYRGELPPLDEEALRVEKALRDDVHVLAMEIGERNLAHVDLLRRAEAFLVESFGEAGYRPELQELRVGEKLARNIEVEIVGGEHASEIVVIGAHYDSAHGPAANDNASGTAALLELARWASSQRFARTVRFVAFVNEEPPYFQVPGQMGSEVYAARCRSRQEDIVAMLSLETLGYYDDRPGSQRYPWPFSWFYPSRGDFVAFVGDLGSRSLVRRAIGAFRADTAFPSEGIALPGSIAGVDWSDHWSFWQHGFEAIMVTDTAIFRYPYYHRLQDTPDKIDFEGLARVVVGLRDVITTLASR
ncbi:MAG: M28 family peptidase [Planctomycetota bacterium]